MFEIEVCEMHRFIAARVQENYSLKPTPEQIDCVLEELGIVCRNLGRRARLLRKYSCPDSLVLPIMREVTFLHVNGII